jgi:hypothetical protein
MKSDNKLIHNGIVGGLCLSSLHLIWIILIFLGWAQPLMDFVFKLHMLNSPFQVQHFNLVLAAGLLILTFTVGAFGGLIFSFFSNDQDINTSHEITID